jgi:hypothetical protein
VGQLRNELNKVKFKLYMAYYCSCLVAFFVPRYVLNVYSALTIDCVVIFIVTYNGIISTKSNFPFLFRHAGL